ncbi:hypothetical protein Patl1_29002 [Pistacia atlantica]|uniref:Uncharacterized protein n=1 Tax=Pistacia atlantica TaxID=434234 RepID=A0ACC1BGN1_9ROSI|nr:hypothetical protein Patl1_29002 [Pistacia atlantica]
MAAEEGQVISCHTIDAWNDQLQKSNETKQLGLDVMEVKESVVSVIPEVKWVVLIQVVVDFTASWCGPCRFITPFLVELAKKLPQVLFLKVDVDELKSVATDWAVEAMPTFMFLKEGKIVDKVVGAKKEELQQTINKHLGSASA